ncbi:MAG TPA: ABC transporter substrate-binding protein [Polyangiaceae bacterium]|nr:ABC transporter substrate-binding protein [Polyangiaceae bacterium]
MFIDRRRLAACAVLLAACGCSVNNDDGDEGGIVIGLLLPFTGSASATASNLERATLYAADRINAGGGIDGTKVRVVSRDTHSEVGRGLAAAEELADAGAVAVIGPESAEIAEEMRPVLAEKQVLFLSPLVGAAAEPSRTCDTPWFRLAPSAKSLGQALAKQARAQQVERVAVLYSTAPYDRALGGAAADRFAKLGGEVALELELNPQAQSYAEVVSEANRAGVTDVILAASPRAGAILINEFEALSSKRPRWFLSPLLKTDLLVQNVAPQALDGAFGVAPKIYEHGEEFPRAFSERWQGDEPLEGAYFYYDAMALLAMALAKSTQADGALELSAAMLDAAGPPGEGVKWDALENGLDQVARGRDLYYTGLTGPLSLQACGSRSTGITSDWTVEQGRIVDLDE